MDKKEKKCFLKPMAKRMVLSIILGILFGILCSVVAWNFDPILKSDPDYFGSALMWNIIFNRFLIGLVIAFAGFITIHPVFGFRMYPAIRGGLIGALVSIHMVFGPFIMGVENAISLIFPVIIVGMIYGMIIDIVATKFTGEGKDLIDDVM